MCIRNEEDEKRMKEKESNPTFTLHPIEINEEILLPYSGGIQAGFTSPAIDYTCDKIDLNQVLIRHSETTFLARAEGDCLNGGKAQIQDGDLIIVDKSLEPRDGDLAVCFLDGEFTMKRVKVEKEEVWLMPDNEKFKPIRVTEDNSFTIWGIITYSIKQHRR